MSGIIGVFERTGKPVQESLINRMLLTMAHRGPDGSHSWTNHNLGFGHCMLQTTPESLFETLPYTNHRGDLTITADARIDNRDELFKFLQISQQESCRISDSQLILLAYDKWGDTCYSKLIGDFAFAIWDEREKKIICVRDYIGVKPLYYYSSADIFIFSSEIKAIISALPHLKTKANLAMVAEHLSFCLCTQDETLFEDIRKVPPGFFHSVSNDTSTSQRYYYFKRKLISYKKEADYTEHFLEIFKQSVSRMLRSNTTIGLELSGGLDSSSICGMASIIYQSTPSPSLLAYSQVFPNINCDESAYIAEVMKKWGISAQIIQQHSFSPPDYKKYVQDTFSLPEPPNMSLFSSVKECVQSDGTRVVISGNGGDQWFQGSNYVYLDILKSLNFSLFFSELFPKSYSRLKHNLKYLFLNLIWLVVPELLRAKVRRNRYKNSFPPWLQGSFIEQTSLIDRVTEADTVIKHPDLAYAQIFQFLNDGVESYFLGIKNHNCARYSFEYRFPFFDRQLVEFALNIPEYQRIRKDKTKYILRNAGNMLLPEQIKNRPDKATFEFVLLNTFDNNLFAKIIKNIVTDRNCWIKGGIIENHYEKAVSGLRRKSIILPRYSWELWFAFAVELWYELCIDENNSGIKR
jgi:asparagine synthase (glutamine-hydrolysing)